MRSEWQRKKLREVCALDKRHGIHADLPYIGMEDIESQTGRFLGSHEPQKVKSSTFRFTSDHILYGRLRPYLNKVYLPDFEGHCSTEIFPIKPSESISREYLSYWFLMETTVNRINATCTGARMPRANMDAVLDFDFLLPPLKEQQRIVAILDEAFAGIATATANAEKNLQNARELFESTLQSVFAEKGEGWTEEPLANIADVVDSLHKTPSYIDKGGYPMVRVTDIKNGTLELDNAKRVDESTYVEFSKRHVAQVGDLVLSRVGTYGVPALVESEEPFCLGQNTAFISPKIHSIMFYYFLRSPVSKKQIDRMVAGTTQPTISLKSIKAIKVPVPSTNDQQEIALKLSSVDAEINRLESIYLQKMNEFEELKQSILKKAFAGELH